MTINVKMTLSWVLRLVASFIMIQTLFFKFSAAEESVYIFSTLGMEPWGRIGTGVVELVASLFLLLPRTVWLGAFIGVGVMAGAIFFHVTMLGIEVKNDGGLLFVYALITLISCMVLLFFEKPNVERAIKLIRSK